MSIRRVQNDAGQIPLQMLRGQAGAPPGPPPAMLQSLPKDTVGLGKQPSTGGSAISGDRRLSDLKPEELASLKGGSALESLASSRSNMTVSQVQPLLRNPAALNSIAGLMEKRSDLNVEDFVSRDMKGRVRIDHTYKDEESMKFLEDRSDVTPRQLSGMRSSMTQMMRDPKMGKDATMKALKLMKDRPDMTPESATKLMSKIGTSVGLGDNKQGNSQMAASAALDMFDDASKLLKKRGSMHPERVGELIGSVGELSGKKDDSRATNVAKGFKSAVKTLENNPLREPEGLSRMAGTIGKQFKGDDSKSAGARMDAFATGAKMMGDHTHLNAEGINTMLNKAKERNPKLKGPGKGAKLLGALKGTQSDLANGKVNVTQATDPGHKAKPEPKLGNQQAKNKKKQQQAGTKGQGQAQSKSASQGQSQTQVAQGQTGTTSPSESAGSSGSTTSSPTSRT